MLGLHSLMHKAETFNPKLALPGRFDFAFIPVYLLPLFVIAFMHDWISSERESGHLRLLATLPLRPAKFWWRRALLRYAVLLIAIGQPLPVRTSSAGAKFFQVIGVVTVICLYKRHGGSLQDLLYPVLFSDLITDLRQCSPLPSSHVA